MNKRKVKIMKLSRLFLLLIILSVAFVGTTNAAEVNVSSNIVTSDNLGSHKCLSFDGSDLC